VKSGLAFTVLCLSLLSCKPQSSKEGDAALSVKAEYVLPYPVGREYACAQGFDNAFSHYGTFRYASISPCRSARSFTAARKGGSSTF